MIYDAALDDLLQRVWNGQRISQADALRLYHLPLEELGALADRRRQLAKQDAYGGRGNEIVTYNVDRNVNYTNVCNVYCKFCAERFPTDEGLLPRPFSPYGVTKLAGEHLTLLYGRNFRMPVAALRYFTVYGPRQRPDMAFHRFCRAMLAGEPITVYGDGRQSRDFTFVSDAIEANVRASWGGEFAAYVHHNVLATQRLLERCKGLPLERFVYASSSSVYGRRRALPDPRGHAAAAVLALRRDQAGRRAPGAAVRAQLRAAGGGVISQMPADRDQILGEEMAPSTLVGEAMADRVASISYTYTEPTIFFEYALDTSRLAVKEGLRNVFVSNGYMTEECLREIHPDLHAANVDLKGFTEKYYREQCGAKLEPVLNTLRTMKEMGVWLEVTTLLISSLNDSPEELRGLAQFLTDLDPDIPWHISRFHPAYRLMNVPPTPAKSVQRARDIGYEVGLRYVYTGNLPGDEGEKTFYHTCRELLVDRYGFYVRRNVISENRCPKCSPLIPGVWS